MTVDARRLDPLPPGRLCTGCRSALRFSHVGYVGKGEAVSVHVCTRCGLAYRGGVRPTAGTEACRTDSPARRSKRPLPDEGSPDNPVLDRTTAELLRERFAEP